MMGLIERFPKKQYRRTVIGCCSEKPQVQATGKMFHLHVNGQGPNYNHRFKVVFDHELMWHLLMAMPIGDMKDKGISPEEWGDWVKTTRKMLDVPK